MSSQHLYVIALFNFHAAKLTPVVHLLCFTSQATPYIQYACLESLAPSCERNSSKCELRVHRDIHPDRF